MNDTKDLEKSRQIIAILFSRLILIFIVAPLCWNFIIVASFPMLPTVPFYFFMALRIVLLAITSRKRYFEFIES